MREAGRSATDQRDVSASEWRAPGSLPAEAIPGWLRQLVRLMDSAVRVPGTELRIGFDPILGALLPGVGDLLGAIPSLLLLSIAAREGVPLVVMLRMVLNMAVDTLVGVVPVLGDFFDATFHSNELNLALLEQHIGPRRPARARDYLVVGVTVVFIAFCVLLPVVLVVMLLKALVSSG